MASKQIKPDDMDYGIQTGTTNTVYVTWKWTVKNTDSFQIKWFYRTGDNILFNGQTSTISADEAKNAIYTPPSNAVKVVFQIKPIPKTHEVNGVETEYWTSIWSTRISVNVKEGAKPPQDTDAPTVSISGYKLVAELDIYDDNTQGGYFKMVANDTKMVGKSGFVEKIFNHISYSFDIAPGNIYKVRFKPEGWYTGAGMEGNWSQYSSPISTIPQAVDAVSGYALTETSVRLEWRNIPVGATSYTIEYAINIDYFDASSEVNSVTIEGANSYAIVTGLTSGERYYFRVKSSNDQGDSPWSNFADVILGTVPNPPTTWMSRSTIKVGESITLYWVHNSADGSKESEAELRIQVGSAPPNTITVFSQNDSTGISEYTYMPSNTIGFSIKWEVRTKGILPVYSDWSVQRSFEVFETPIGYINIFKTLKWWWDTFNFKEDSIYTAKGDFTDSIANDPIITRFPIFIVGGTEPASQSPISCHFSISPMTAYQSIDYTGEEVWINEGDVIFEVDSDLSKNMTATESGFEIILRLFPEDIILENGIEYRVVFTVALNSGLSVEAEEIFLVSFDEDEYDFDAEIGYDKETASAYIRPYCENDGKLIPDILLSVYRRDYDGKFVELSKNLDSGLNTIVTDPHPPLNFARYRIVGISKINGTIMFNDLPSYPIQEKTIIIQWDDTWKDFDADDGEELAEPVISGSMLRLPYNISTSESGSKDVELVEYIGREHPVSYYGTQVGQAANYSVDIEREDVETLYALRRLSRYMGKVYVREPNGSGYWADVSVSWNVENKAVIIPVTISVKRVEGGI